MLTDEVSIAPDGGKDFGPRHLDFHPTKPWMYVSIETQNKMYTYLMEKGRLKPDIAFRAETLAEPGNIRARQAAGTVHVHPNGRFLYGANRAEETVEYQGKKVFKGGENSIVVYAINQSTGEPTPIQHIETQKHPPAHLPHRPERAHAGRRTQPAGQCARRRCGQGGAGRTVDLPHRG